VLFDALVFSYVRRNGLRTLLTLLAVAGSVAIILILDIAAATLAASLAAANDTVADDTNLSLVASPGGFDERLLARVRGSAGVLDARPAMRDTIVVRDARGAQERLDVRGRDLLIALPHGIDPRQSFPGPFVRSGSAPSFSALLRDDGIFVSKRFARAFELRSGSALHDATDSHHRLRVAGLLRDVAGVDSNVAFVDIATAQHVFSKAGRLDRIDCVVAPEALDALRERLRASLPASITLREPASVARENAAFIRAVRGDLAAFAALVMLLAAGAIANALAIAVEARRAEIGILRTVGATRRQIFAVFLVEGATLGTLGSLLGLGVGVTIVQHVLPNVLTRVDGVVYEFGQVGHAFVSGVTAATLAALVPARSAARTPPVLAMRTRGLEASFTTTARRLGIGAALCAVASFALPPLASTLAIIAAAVSVVPFALLVLGALSRHWQRSRIALVIALRDLNATARRTYLARHLTLTRAHADHGGDGLCGIVSHDTARARRARVSRRPSSALRRAASTRRSTPTREARGAHPCVSRCRDGHRDGEYLIVVSARVAPTLIRRRIEGEPLAQESTIENTRELRGALVARLQSTVAVAYALAFATFAIAMLGVATTLAALVLERFREIALLRYVGMTSRGVRDMVLCMAALVGVLASTLGIALGLIVAWRLIGTTDAHLLGASIVVRVPYGALGSLVVATVLGALAAGVYPAQRASAIRAVAVEVP